MADTRVDDFDADGTLITAGTSVYTLRVTVNGARYPSGGGR